MRINNIKTIKRNGWNHCRIEIDQRDLVENPNSVLVVLQLAEHGRRHAASRNFWKYSRFFFENSFKNEILKCSTKNTPPSAACCPFSSSSSSSIWMSISSGFSVVLCCCVFDAPRTNAMLPSCVLCCWATCKHLI